MSAVTYSRRTINIPHHSFQKIRHLLLTLEPATSDDDDDTRCQLIAPVEKENSVCPD